MSNLQRKEASLILGIDAFNIRRGGGVTHLVELLRVSNPAEYNFKKVILWGSESTLNMVENRGWLKKVHVPLLDRGLFSRIFWHRFLSKKVASNANCDVVLYPGGAFLSGFSPSVTMSRNMLPFEWKELKRFGLSVMFLKLLLLRFSQVKSFKNADGIIFLTKYAFNMVSNYLNLDAKSIAIVPHGVNEKFFQSYKGNRRDRFTLREPCRILYVSTVSPYKHQDNVAKAVSMLRIEGYPVRVDFVGASDIGLERLSGLIERLDPYGEFITYHGAVQYEVLENYYNKADIGIFASSCENMPNILLENMAAGLPIACSKMGPMPSILGDSGVYFDPLKCDEIVDVLRNLIESSALRNKYARLANNAAIKYSWNRCANETFDYLLSVAISGSNEDLKYVSK